MIRRLIILWVGLVVAALVGLDYGARALVAAAVAHQVRKSTGAASASAHVSGFPFLYDALGQGRVPGLKVDLTGVPAGPLTLQAVDVDLHEVHFDRHALYASRKVRVTSIARGTASVTVSAPELSAVAHIPVILTSSGTLLATVGGITVPATASITRRHFLTLEAAGRSLLSVDLAGTPIVPDCDMGLVVVPTGVTATCAMAPVPPAVLDVISSR